MKRVSRRLILATLTILTLTEGSRLIHTVSSPDLKIADVVTVDVVSQSEVRPIPQIDKLQRIPKKPSAEPNLLLKWTDVREGEDYPSKKIQEDKQRISNHLGANNFGDANPIEAEEIEGCGAPNK